MIVHRQYVSKHISNYAVSCLVSEVSTLVGIKLLMHARQAKSLQHLHKNKHHSTKLKKGITARVGHVCYLAAVKQMYTFVFLNGMICIFQSKMTSDLDGILFNFIPYNGPN